VVRLDFSRQDEECNGDEDEKYDAAKAFRADNLGESGYWLGRLCGGEIVGGTAYGEEGRALQEVGEV
jgi:hypothetical protein